MVVGTGPVTFEELVAVARDGAPVVLGEDAVGAVVEIGLGIWAVVYLAGGAS